MDACESGRAPQAADKIDLRSIGDRLRLRERFQAINLSGRGARLGGPAHLLEDIREEEVRSYLVGLPRDRAALRLKSVFKPILLHPENGEASERFRVVQIEPAGMAKRLFS